VDAITALRAQVGWRSLHVDRVDGGDPRTSPRLGRLLAAGFQQDYKGLLLSRGPADASA
jgi:hypothetical protein